MFDVDVITDAARFTRMRSAWNALLASSRADALFLTWEWLHTWWQHMAGDRSLFIVTMRQDDELVALAPLMRNRAWPRQCEFLGTGSVGSDYLDFIVRKGCEDAAVEALTRFLGSISLRLPSLRQDSFIATAFARKLRSEGWRSRTVQMQECPYIDLSSGSWDAYLASRSYSHRYNFRRRLRNLQRSHDVEFQRAESDHERREALRQVIALHLQRWNERGGSDGFHEARLIAFHEQFSALAQNNGWLRLRVLQLDGRPAGAFYGFRYGKRTLFYQSGFDARFSSESVGLVTLGLTIREAIEEGSTEYDLLHGDESYKFLWTSLTRPLVRMEFYPPGVVGRIHRDSVAAFSATKKIVRRALDAPLNR